MCCIEAQQWFHERIASLNIRRICTVSQKITSFYSNQHPTTHFTFVLFFLRNSDSLMTLMRSFHEPLLVCVLFRVYIFLRYSAMENNEPYIIVTGIYCTFIKVKNMTSQAGNWSGARVFLAGAERCFLENYKGAERKSERSGASFFSPERSGGFWSAPIPWSQVHRGLRIF